MHRLPIGILAVVFLSGALQLAGACAAKNANGSCHSASNNGGAGPAAGTPPVDGESAGNSGAGGAPIADSGNPRGGSSDPGCGGPAYCNDFEALAPGTRPGLPLQVKVGAGATLTVDSTHAKSGTQSIKVTSADGARAFLNLPVTGLLPSEKRIAYARMMLWMENLPGSSGHWDVIAMSGPAMGQDMTWNANYSFGGFGDTQSKLLYYATTPGKGLADCSKASPPQLPLGQWNCVEMAVDETAAQHYVLKVNGQIVPGGEFKDTTADSNCCCGSNNNNTWYVPDVANVRFGWYYAHKQLTAVTFWIDDVAVSEHPIGCPP